MTERFIPTQLWNDEFRFLKIRKGGKEPTADMGQWQIKNFKYNSTELLNYLIQGGNYGIIGGYGNLILIDSDSPEISEIAEQLPKTFTIKTGSPEEYKKHYFFITDKLVKPIRLSENHNGDKGDVRSAGQYVVAPTSIHPSGNPYEVLRNIPIANITEEEIREAFKDYIDVKDNTEFKTYPVDTKLRNSRFIKECRLPDYCIENKLKGDSGKNWKLFPYLVDILHNRQSGIPVYEKILTTQKHKVGAIKGWVKLAMEGKLAKTSCQKCRDYLDRFHPEELKKVCDGCPLYETTKEIKKIEANKDYSKLQKEVLTQLALKQKDTATEMIVKEIESNSHIYTTRDDIKSEMWIYDEGIYVPQGKSFVREFVRKILMETFTPQLANNVIAKIEADTFIDHDRFFSTNYVFEVPLLNGILNIKTRELTPFNPKKIFFNKIPIEYDPSKECEQVITHFKTILKNEDDIPVIIEMFGYLLLKEYKIEKAFMFVGHGRNGKSKTVELMKRFIGAENCSSLPLKSLHEESFSLSELFGKMANLSADLSKTDLRETGMIKALIGRDTIQAKRKFLRDLNFVNYAKMVFAANELPRIYDTTDGFWTKWVLIEFPYKFVTEKNYYELPKEERDKHKIMNPDIMEHLSTPEQLSGLLNLALDSLDRLLENKDFSYSKNVKEVKDLWIRQSDSFTAFCYDHIKEDNDSQITKKELRKFYYKYTKKHKVGGTSDKSIKITLENMYGVSESQVYGSGDRFWEGIKLNGLDNLNK